MGEIELEEISKIQLERRNSFYGRRRILKFSVAAKEIWLTFIPRVAMGKSLSIGSFEFQGKAIKVYLPQWPNLSDVDPKFQEVNGKILPRELQLLFWEAALSPLLETMGSLLNGKISLVSFEENSCAMKDLSEAIGFHAYIPSEQRSLMGYWQVWDADLDTLLQDFWKRQATVPSRTYHDLRVDYVLELGSTELTRECYEKLQEEDLILLDHYFLEPGAVSQLRGLDPFQVNVIPCKEGFCVQKVQC
jgi:hypothetical protein